MTRIDKIKEILKEMTEEERLELIRLDLFNQLFQINSYYRICDIRNKRICFENPLTSIEHYLH